MSEIERESGDYWANVKNDGEDVILRIGWRFFPTITLRHSPAGAKYLADRLVQNAREVDSDTDKEDCTHE